MENVCKHAGCKDWENGLFYENLLLNGIARPNADTLPSRKFASPSKVATLWDPSLTWSLISYSSALLLVSYLSSLAGRPTSPVRTMLSPGTMSFSYKKLGSVPALPMVVSCWTVLWWTAAPKVCAHSFISWVSWALIIPGGSCGLWVDIVKCCPVCGLLYSLLDSVWNSWCIQGHCIKVICDGPQSDCSLHLMSCIHQQNRN